MCVSHKLVKANAVMPKNIKDRVPGQAAWTAAKTAHEPKAARSDWRMHVGQLPKLSTRYVRIFKVVSDIVSPSI